MTQPEVQDRLGWVGDVAVVSGQPRTRGACAGSDQTANEGTLAAPSDATDQRTAPGAAAHHGTRSFTFALASRADRRRLQAVRAATNDDGDQPDR